MKRLMLLALVIGSAVSNIASGISNDTKKMFNDFFFGLGTGVARGTTHRVTEKALGPVFNDSIIIPCMYFGTLISTEKLFPDRFKKGPLGDFSLSSTSALIGHAIGQTIAEGFSYDFQTGSSFNVRINLHTLAALYTVLDLDGKVARKAYKENIKKAKLSNYGLAKYGITSNEKYS